MAGEPFRTAASDNVERSVAPESQVVDRDKGVSRGAALAFVGLAVFVAFVGFAATLAGEIGEVGMGLAFAIAMTVALLGVMLSVQRATVTRMNIHIRTGLRTLHIPLAAVTGAKLYSRYRTAAPSAVIVDYAVDGKSRASWIATPVPELLLAAIEQARAGPSYFASSEVAPTESGETMDAGTDEPRKLAGYRFP